MGLGNKSGANAYNTPRYTSMQLQTSAQGLPVPLLWGTNRLSPNLFWYGDFKSTPVKSKGGGKGGSKGGSAYTYSAAVMLGLCEGPLVDMHSIAPSVYPNPGTFIGQVWRDQAQLILLSKINMIEGNGVDPPGSATQGVWSYLTTNHPSQAIPYSSLAYVASPKYGLGYSPSLPDHSFECFGKFAGSYTQQSQQFNTTGTIPGLTDGCVYTDSTNFPGTTFTVIDILGSGPPFTLLCSPAPGGYSGSGTLTLQSGGAAPATISYTSTSVVTSPLLDANPADIIDDFLTNPQYSIGLASSVVDSISLATYKAYCAAQGIFFSPLLNQQEQMSSVIDRWASLSNTMIFWSEGQIKFVPLGDSALTNTSISPNASYTPNLTVAAALTYDDYVVKDAKTGAAAPPVTVTRIDPADAPNHVKLEVRDRGNAYNSQPVEWQYQALVNQYGQIDSPVSQAHEICSLAIASTVAQLVGQRVAFLRDSYDFTLGIEFSYLEPGDILTLTEPHIGLVAQPVRIKTIDEDENYDLKILAEEFPGTLGTAFAQNIQVSSAGGFYNENADPGDVNPPAIFEPSSALTNGLAQVWLSVSGGANWGGATVLVSFDGTNYTQIGTLSQAATQGVLTSGLVSASGLDNTHTLAIDTTESLLAIPTDATNPDAQAYRTLTLLTSAFTASGSPPSATCPDTGELLAYGAVSATGTYTANLTYLERGLYGMGPAAFSTGDFFSRIELAQTNSPLGSVLIYDLPSGYIGHAIHFKFLSFNAFGNELQDASTVVAYQYTPTGRGYGGGSGGVPSAPTGVSATATSHGIMLAWSANASTDNVTSYQVLRGTSHGGPYSQVFSGNVLTWTDTGVSSSTIYYYVITATNLAGTSADSSEVNATAL